MTAEEAIAKLEALSKDESVLKISIWPTCSQGVRIDVITNTGPEGYSVLQFQAPTIIEAIEAINHES